MADTRERALHWDLTYKTKGPTGVSWYQTVPRVSLKLIGELGVSATAPVIDVGGGESTLVDHLVAEGFDDMTVLDVSAFAVDGGRERIGDEKVRWLVADVLTWQPERIYELWHDRAVFHFPVELADQSAYLNALHVATAPGSAVIVGTFAPNGPESCSGLPIVRYSADQLESVLGERFKVEACLEEQHVTPAGGIQTFTWVAGKMT